MGRRKAAQNCNIRPWASARLDNKERRFIQVGDSLLKSQYFQRLTFGARWLYICMVMESGGEKAFSFPLATAQKKYGIKPASLRRDVQSLIDAGFIRKFSGACVRQPNTYEFILLWKEKAEAGKQDDA